MKKEHLYILGVVGVVLAILAYKKYVGKLSLDKDKKVDSYDGAVSFDENGIKVFNVDWKNKTFSFLAVADTESVQGVYELERRDGITSPNNQGMSQFSTGWSFRYEKRFDNKVKGANLVLTNKSKNTTITKMVCFDKKRVI